MTDAASTAEDDLPVSEWPRARKVAWRKARAAGEPWHLAANAMIQDMDLMGIPLTSAAIQLGTLEGMSRGERGVRDWVDGIQ